MRLGVPVRRCLCVPINTPGWRGTLQGTSLKPLPKTQVSRFFETEINIIVHYDGFQSGEGEVARTLISHRYGSGSIPGSGDTCRLCFFFFFFVLVLASWVSLWDLPFCFPAKTNILIFFSFLPKKRGRPIRRKPIWICESSWSRKASWVTEQQE